MKSSVLKGPLTSSSLFHVEAVSLGQLGLQCWRVWPRLPLSPCSAPRNGGCFSSCHGERRCAFSAGPLGFCSALLQPVRIPLLGEDSLVDHLARLVCSRPGLVSSPPQGLQGFLIHPDTWAETRQLGPSPPPLAVGGASDLQALRKRNESTSNLFTFALFFLFFNVTILISHLSSFLILPFNLSKTELQVGGETRDDSKSFYRSPAVDFSVLIL